MYLDALHPYVHQTEMGNPIEMSVSSFRRKIVNLKESWQDNSDNNFVQKYTSI